MKPEALIVIPACLGVLMFFIGYPIGACVDEYRGTNIRIIPATAGIALIVLPVTIVSLLGALLG